MEEAGGLLRHARRVHTIRSRLWTLATFAAVFLRHAELAACGPADESLFSVRSGTAGAGYRAQKGGTGRFLLSARRFTGNLTLTIGGRDMTVDSVQAFIESSILSMLPPTDVAPSIFSMKNLPVMYVDFDGTHSVDDDLYSRLSALEAEGIVVEEDVKVFALQENGIPDDPLYREGRQWGLEKIGASSLWRRGLVGSKALDVVVVDTGLDVGHPDIIDNVGINAGEIPNNGIDDDENGFVDDYYGYNPIAGNGDVSDGNGHGTHAAGIIAATGNNGVGIAGTALEVSLRPCKFLDDRGGGRISDAIRCLDWALEIGAPVSSNSWGGGGFSRIFSDMLDTLEERGHLFVAAAGNINSREEANERCPFYPAAYPQSNVLSVAATDTDDCLTSFSCSTNRGVGVDVAAPGLNIISTYPGAEYRRLSGTSMACPFVAGLAALLLCQPGQDCSGSSIGPRQIAQVKQAIVSTAVDPSGCLGGSVSSGGRIDAARAADALLSAPPLPAAIAEADLLTWPVQSSMSTTPQFQAADFMTLNTLPPTADAPAAASSSGPPIRPTSPSRTSRPGDYLAPSSRTSASADSPLSPLLQARRAARPPSPVVGAAAQSAGASAMLTDEQIRAARPIYPRSQAVPDMTLAARQPAEAAASSSPQRPLEPLARPLSDSTPWESPSPAAEHDISLVPPSGGPQLADDGVVEFQIDIPPAMKPPPPPLLTSTTEILTSPCIVRGEDSALDISGGEFHITVETPAGEDDLSISQQALQGATCEQQFEPGPLT